MWDTSTRGLAKPKVVRTGTTLTYSSSGWSAHLAFAFDLRCNQCLVSVVIGDFEYQSEWLEVPARLLSLDSGQRILRELERWLALVTMPFSRPQTSLKKMYLISVTYEIIEDILESELE